MKEIFNNCCCFVQQIFGGEKESGLKAALKCTFKSQSHKGVLMLH